MEKSTVVTSRMTRGRNQILSQRFLNDNGLSTSSNLPVIRGVILSVRDFVVCGGRVISPRFLRHNLPSNSLFHDG